MSEPRRIPQRFEPWESDPAHLACVAWVNAWRETAGADEPLPSLAWAEHLGRHACDMAAAGIPRLELQRLFAAAGYDRECVADCDQQLPEPLEVAARRAAVAERARKGKRR